MVIDIHTFIGQHPLHEFSQNSKDLIKVMEKYNISKSVVMPFATMKIEKNNDAVAKAAKSSDKLIPFACIDPSADDYLSEVSRVKKLGMKGIMLDPEFHNIFNNLPRVESMMVACLDDNLPILLNTSNIRALSRHDEYVKGLGQIASKYPEIILLVSPYWPRLAELMKNHQNIIVDTCGHHNVPGWVPLIEDVGATRICMGSESPINHPAMTIKNIMTRKMQPNYRELILGKNAEKLFKKIL